MQYMLSIYVDESTVAAAMPGAADAPFKMSAAFEAYTQAMKSAGVWVGGDRLRPSSFATTVRVRDGQTKAMDGPYADTKEQLAGYYLIETPDMDAALDWAARCPAAAGGSVEVRPLWPM